MTQKITIVIPAKDEAETIADVINRAKAAIPDADVIVVDDGSTDPTASSARSAGARVISHPYSMGNGAAIKSGVRGAQSDWVICMDGDGQHAPEDIPRLLEKLEQGFHLVVGARDANGHANGLRRFANGLYNRLATWVVGHRVVDLTSGYRGFARSRFMTILPLLPNGFSYPTTSTIAFFRLGYPVAFVPIDVSKRSKPDGSHIRVLRDGSKFFLIIFRIAALYSPLKVFFPTAVSFFSAGIGYYIYTFTSDGRFTNFGALLLTTSVLIFLIGLVAEQITTLIYTSADQSDSPGQM